MQQVYEGAHNPLQVSVVDPTTELPITTATVTLTGVLDASGAAVTGTFPITCTHTAGGVYRGIVGADCAWRREREYTVTATVTAMTTLGMMTLPLRLLVRCVAGGAVVR